MPDIRRSAFGDLKDARGKSSKRDDGPAMCKKLSFRE